MLSDTMQTIIADVVNVAAKGGFLEEMMEEFRLRAEEATDVEEALAREYDLDDDLEEEDFEDEEDPDEDEDAMIEELCQCTECDGAFGAEDDDETENLPEIVLMNDDGEILSEYDADCTEADFAFADVLRAALNDNNPRDALDLYVEARLNGSQPHVFRTERMDGANPDTVVLQLVGTLAGQYTTGDEL